MPLSVVRRSMPPTVTCSNSFQAGEVPTPFTARVCALSNRPTMSRLIM